MSACPPIIGSCSSLQRVVQLARRFAPSTTPVLIIGDTGTGKDLLARWVHAWSERPGQFVDVNCGSLPGDLVEGLLFGHRRGAFTGAFENTTGLVQEADGGTLFLDELCSLPPPGQVKLLRVLESGELRRVGETAARRVDFRLVAAVQPPVDERLEAGQLRRDLYQRLAGLVLTLPPLAERGEDVVRLARHFASRLNIDLEPGVAGVLREHTWPGNVRELQAAIVRGATLAAGGVITPEGMREAIALGCPGANGNRHRTHLQPSAPERERLLTLCIEHGWQADRIAEALAVHRSTLFRRLRRHGISLRARVPESHELRDRRMVE